LDYPLPESVSQSSQFGHSQNVEPQSRVFDRELNGELNRASAEGAKFALLLAMLEQDYLHRPKLIERDPEDDDNRENSISSICHYPPTPLKAELQHWTQANYASEVINKESIASAHLWLIMHPQPLSLHNNAYQINDDILANCDVHTQTRYRNAADKNLQVDEIGLYDILQGMNEGIETAA
jgi:hypothetical protein